jgi:hypothetical protein
MSPIQGAHLGRALRTLVTLTDALPSLCAQGQYAGYGADLSQQQQPQPTATQAAPIQTTGPGAPAAQAPQTAQAGQYDYYNQAAPTAGAAQAQGQDYSAYYAQQASLDSCAFRSGSLNRMGAVSGDL